VTVAELIKILQRADPEAEVFSEFEGDFGPTDPSEVRVGEAVWVDTGAKYADGKPMDPSLFRSNHPFVTKYIPEGRAKEVKRCTGVLLWSGQSGRHWPKRLDGLPSEDEQ
jgi:hypothetical protein